MKNTRTQTGRPTGYVQNWNIVFLILSSNIVNILILVYVIVFYYYYLSIVGFLNRLAQLSLCFSPKLSDLIHHLHPYTSFLPPWVFTWVYVQHTAAILLHCDLLNIHYRCSLITLYWYSTIYRDILGPNPT